MVVEIIVAFIFLLLLALIPQYPEYELAKKRYYKFLSNLRGTRFEHLSRPVVLAGYHYRGGNVLGWNSLKGSEISVCIDGKANEIMHVLLHEFCHQTVPEYSHSKNFWNNLDVVKDMAQSMGVYEKIQESRKICGAHVTDRRK